MTKEEIQKKVFEIVADRLDRPIEDLSLETSFKHDLAADSLATLELILALEENFEMTIGDEEAENIKKIGDAVEYISQHLKK